MVIGSIRLLSSSATRPAPIELFATLYLPSLPQQEKASGLVVGHGAGSRRQNHDEFCREACSQGFVVVALDFRGHGESGGMADGPLEEDIRAAVDHLRTLPFVAPDRLCYRGSSMGGFYGLKAATTEDFAAVVLLCPAGEQVILDALDEADPAAARTEAEAPAAAEVAEAAPPAGGERPLWDRAALRGYFEAQDSTHLAGLVSSPVFIVHARGDEVVPFDHSLHLAGALAGPATLLALPGGSHTTAQHDPDIHRLTTDWLRAQVC